MLKFLLSRIPEEPPKPRILLVDDDRDIRTVTGMVLATRGVGTIYEAAGGRQGLQLARDHQPDMILLDVKLPDITGETVLQLLKADPWTQHIPVVFFTASADGLSRLRALPVSDVVIKPFDPERLWATLQRAIRNRGYAAPMGVGRAVGAAVSSAPQAQA